MTRPATGSVLDARTLNRSYLARQLLLDRVDLAAADALEHLIGLQAQEPGDPYVALWSRLRGFDPAELATLLERRDAVRMTLMRTTIHLVTARDALALRPVLQSVCARIFGSSAFQRNVAGLDLDAVLGAGQEIVETAPVTAAELGRALAVHWPDRHAPSLAHAVRFLLPLVQVPPRGLWGRSGAARLTTLSSWLGSPVAVDGEADELVLRYLRAFGPATVADIRTWSGLSGLRVVTERLRPQLRAYRDERGRELLDVEDGRFVDPDAPAPVRFLPQYDNLFLSHADRGRITSDASWPQDFFFYRGIVFVDGWPAAGWKLEQAGGSRARAATLAIEPVRSLKPAERSAVSAEGEALLSFLAAGAGATASGIRLGAA
jgi:hypothetical protein